MATMHQHQLYCGTAVAGGLGKFPCKPVVSCKSCRQANTFSHGRGKAEALYALKAASKQQASHASLQQRKYPDHRCSRLHAVSMTSTGEQDSHLPPWRKVVAVTAGCLLLFSLHRNTFSVLLPDLCQQLGLRASQAGAVQAAMLTAYLVGQVPAGRLADKFGGTRVLLCGLALWSTATALTAAAGHGVTVTTSGSSSIWPLAIILVSRVMLGLASACAMPCVTATAVEWVPTTERASMISFVYANSSIGGVIGLTMVPLLADALGGGAAFLVSGALGVTWALCGAVIMRQLQQSPTHSTKASSQSNKQQEKLSWRLDAGSWRQVALLCYAHGVIGLGFFFMQSFIPLLLSSLGSGSLALTGRLSSQPWMAAAVIGMMAGTASDSMIRGGLPNLFVRRLMQGISFLGCGLSVIPLAINPNPGLMPAVWCLTANLTFYSCSYGGFHAHLLDVAGKYAGVLQGLTNSASILMGILGNLLAGFVVDSTGSYSAVFWLLAFVYISGAIVWCCCSTSYELQPAS